MTSKLGNFETDLDENGEWHQNVLKRVIESKFFPVLSLVTRHERLTPLDPDLVFENEFGSVLIFNPVRNISPNVLGAELDAALSDARSNKCDQGLDVDNSSESLKSILLKVAKIIFDSGLQLDVSEIGATFDQLRRYLARIMKDQNHSCRVSKHNWNSTFFAFVRSDLVEELAIALYVETENSPNVDCEKECLEDFCIDVASRLNLADLQVARRTSILEEGSGLGNKSECFLTRNVRHDCWLLIRQIVVGKFATEPIVPGNVNERLNWGRSKMKLVGPRFSPLVRIFFSKTVNA